MHHGQTTAKKRSSEILADENQTFFFENIKTFSMESEKISEIGEESETGTSLPQRDGHP